VPDTLAAALSPQWLTAALRLRYPVVKVARVVAGPVVDRVSTNARFAIDLVGSAPPELPTRLCVKGYFNDVGGRARFIGESEAYFYRDVADGLGVRTLRTLYADVEQETRHGVVLSADVAAGGGEFLDVRSSLGPSDVADSLSQLAGLHAASWAAPAWTAASWLEPRLGRALQSWSQGQTIKRIETNLCGDNGSGIPTSWRDPQRLITAYTLLVNMAGAQQNTPGWCVIHGDAHIGNFFLDADRRPSLLDWQLVQRGMWYIDVGYHIGSALDVDDRRRTERDLLAHYLDCLRAQGVSPPPWESAWRDLGAGILHGMFLWAITTYVDPTTIAIMLNRLGTAAADHSAHSPHLMRHDNALSGASVSPLTTPITKEPR